ncbi:hypothetical protein B0H11DRAFT_1755590, partial [Mycena galericulata]
KAKHNTRTRYPVKCYLVDFGLSIQFPADERSPMDLHRLLSRKAKVSPAIHSQCVHYLPVRNMIREDFIQVYSVSGIRFYGVEFMTPVVDDNDPSDRPSMAEIVDFEGIEQRKAALAGHQDQGFKCICFFRTISHWARRIEVRLKRVPPIPTPNNETRCISGS